MNRFKKHFLAAFFTLCVMQLIAVIYMVAKYESVLLFGDVIILKAEPIDPYDPFRGRYITLNFEQRRININKHFNETSDFFITFNNEGKFAIIDDIFDVPPQDERPYLKVKGYVYVDGEISITYPFNRFYMQEDLAQYVDMRQWNFFNNNEVSVKIRVLNGKGVIENVVVGNVSISEFIKNQK
ncbi:MAG: GDYXXLXY domain-containing protein [Campylobacteraceae bacterium]|jgi:uncharacterized membrane-anchored protein|nr:GDYXXLXY domain-containing protein [Campylobacteraceae bacterium]